MWVWVDPEPGTSIRMLPTTQYFILKWIQTLLHFKDNDKSTDFRDIFLWRHLNSNNVSLDMTKFNQRIYIWDNCLCQDISSSSLRISRYNTCKGWELYAKVYVPNYLRQEILFVSETCENWSDSIHSYLNCKNLFRSPIYHDCVCGPEIQNQSSSSGEGPAWLLHHEGWKHHECVKFMSQRPLFSCDQRKPPRARPSLQPRRIRLNPPT